MIKLDYNEATRTARFLSARGVEIMKVSNVDRTHADMLLVKYIADFAKRGLEPGSSLFLTRQIGAVS